MQKCSARWFFFFFFALKNVVLAEDFQSFTCGHNLLQQEKDEQILVIELFKKFALKKKKLWSEKLWSSFMNIKQYSVKHPFVLIWLFRKMLYETIKFKGKKVLLTIMTPCSSNYFKIYRFMQIVHLLKVPAVFSGTL